VPPKKSASAYIIFGKEVSIGNNLKRAEKIRDPEEKSHGEGDRSSQGDSLELGHPEQGGEAEIQRGCKEG
jgi:hypothetical protein